MLKQFLSACTALSIMLSSLPVAQAAYSEESSPDGGIKIEWNFDKVSAADVADDNSGKTFVTEIPVFVK